MSMTAAILAEIAWHGVKVRDEDHRISPHAALDDDLLLRIRAHKSETFNELASRRSADTLCSEGAKPSSEIRFRANMTSRVSSLNVSNLAGGRKSRSLRAKSPTRRDRHMQCRHRSSKVPPRRAERSGCEASQSRPDARWPWGIRDPGQALAGRPGIENPPSKESQLGRMKGALGRESDDCAPIRFRPERCKRAK
jgi:hypothetical protein